MDFYFAITSSMIEKYQLNPIEDNSNNFCWTLNQNTFLNSVILDTPGKILDNLHNNDLDLFKEPIAICKASIAQSNIIDVLRCALVGDTVSCPVIISQIIWIHNK